MERETPHSLHENKRKQMYRHSTDVQTDDTQQASVTLCMKSMENGRCDVQADDTDDFCVTLCMKTMKTDGPTFDKRSNK